MDILNLVEIGRERGQAVKDVEQNVVIVAGCVGVDHTDRPSWPAGAHRRKHLPYHVE